MLPPELLREIFLLGRNGGYNACVSTTDNLWRWAQVCRQWRDVCLGFSSLWSDIRLDFVSNASLRLSSSLSSSRHALRVLDKRISHCLGRPIDISIIAPRLHIAGNAILDCIIRRCAQWRTFSMDAPEDAWRSLDTCAGSLRKLNYLNISDSYHGSMANTVIPAYANSILSSFSFVPILRSLSIADVPLHALSLSPTTIQNLNTLCIHLYKQPFAVLELLPRMCSLRCLDVTCDASVKDFKRTLELPTVTSLTLRDGDSPDGLPLVWSLLRLDNLREMSLCYEGTISNPAWPRLSSPVYSITSFTLFYTDSVAEFDYHDEASITLMRCFPNLETLHLTLPFFCNRLFTEIRTNPKFLPRLVHITFLCWDLQKDTDIACIADMLHARRRILECATITRLTLHRSDPLRIHKPVTPGWESLLTTGLHVSFL